MLINVQVKDFIVSKLETAQLFLQLKFQIET